MSSSYGRHLLFPFRIGSDGRSMAVASRAEHVRDELVQLILINLGERLFMPEFGGNTRRLVFENIDEPTLAMTKAMLTDAINRWLGKRLTLESLSVGAKEETIEVDIRYRVAGEEVSRTLTFQRGRE
ncbi:MAG: GPW/gp25 family protein [Proteobacteria bacterium]|nr:GPW/gp25 family protein [Pseudomonadota bacterium]